VLVTKLRIMLVERNYPQVVVAEAAGIKTTRISEYVNGKKPIPIKHVMPLCEVLHCTPDDIVGVVEFNGVYSRG
jgi:DNA-binding Xre family transcriptional regulator